MMLSLSEQIATIYQWLQGRYDTYTQWQAEKTAYENGSGLEPVHDWVQTHIFPLKVPALGSHVLGVRQGFRKGELYRQRLYRFKICEEEGCVINYCYKLKNETLFEKAEFDPSALVDINSDDTELIEGGTVYWEYIEKEQRFHASTKEGACRFISSYAPGKTIIATSDVYLKKDELWSLDRGVDTDGNKIYGFKSNIHHKFTRCALFKGELIVNKEVRKIELHDQGGETQATFGSQTFTIILGQIEYTKDGPLRGAKLLQLSLFKEGQEEAVWSTVCDHGSKLVGGLSQAMEVYLERSSDNY